MKDCIYNDKAIFNVECLSDGEIFNMSINVILNNLKCFNQINEKDENLRRNYQKVVSEKKQLLRNRLVNIKNTRLNYYKQNIQNVINSSLNFFVGDIVFDKTSFENKIKSFRLQSSKPLQNPLIMSQNIKISDNLIKSKEKNLLSNTSNIRKNNENNDLKQNRNKFLNININDKLKLCFSGKKSSRKHYSRITKGTTNKSILRHNASESFLSSNKMKIKNKKDTNNYRLIDSLALDNLIKFRTKKIETFSNLSIENSDLPLVKSASCFDLNSKQIFKKKEQSLKIKNNSVFQIVKKTISSTGERSIPSKNNLKFFIGSI